jgi:hypothetical protein
LTHHAFRDLDGRDAGPRDTPKFWRNLGGCFRSVFYFDGVFCFGGIIRRGIVYGGWTIRQRPGFNDSRPDHRPGVPVRARFVIQALVGVVSHVSVVSQVGFVVHVGVITRVNFGSQVGNREYPCIFICDLGQSRRLCDLSQWLRHRPAGMNSTTGQDRVD